MSHISRQAYDVLLLSLYVYVQFIAGEECSVHVCVCTCVQTSSESIGVKLALGETQVVAETRQFLLDHDIALDAFSQVCLCM